MEELRAIIPQDALDKGQIKIYLDTPLEIENAVKEYNKRMSESKIALRRVEIFKEAIMVMTPMMCLVLSVLGITGNMLGTRVGKLMGFWNYPVCISVLAAAVVVYFYWGIWKGYVGVVVAASAALIIVQWLAAAAIVLNMIFYMIYRHTVGPLKKEKEYPIFSQIVVRYERVNKPHYYEE